MRTQEKTEFIGQVQYNISQILLNLNSLLALKNEYLSLGLGSAGIIIDADFSSIPSAAGITAVEFQAAITSAISIDTFLQGTGYQNMYKIKKL